MQVQFFNQKMMLTIETTDEDVLFLKRIYKSKDTAVIGNCMDSLTGQFCCLGSLVRLYDT